MQTNTQTTFILLERGSEDIALLNELYKITADLKIKGIKEFASKYPKLNELKHSLITEDLYEWF